MSSDDESMEGGAPPEMMIEDCDDQTLRIMISTDNHLGYLEEDPIRGDDSFAALEEVLYHAKHYGCDMVLLSGDLFHDNRPSRLTLFKAMNIFRRYCMGENPVTIQILSDQKENFRRGVVNYQDEFFSVDLPVMSIHGNHDCPASEGSQGSHLLAALDLLDTANLVNYIGRQENNKEVEISPLLIKKGDTRLALYGLGSMREERLNRLWQNSKCTFLRPTAGEGEDEPHWFNMFTLHQNRDKGRGSKNCVNEQMIPEWMDLVIWGHEHESLIEPQESAVGTFRISQPGSSVATSLVAGEAVRKQVGILDIRGTAFRLRPIPLTQVRTFAIGELSLSDQPDLNPDDPKVEQNVKQRLKEEVDLLIHRAKRKSKELIREARRCGNIVAGAVEYPLENQLRKPQEVLVRLKVEHAGFSAVNNQRFGAGFVGQAANTNDILLFQRRKAQTRRSGKKQTSNSEAIAPEALEEVNIEDFIVGELDADNNLDIFDETRMAAALDEYVSKQQAQAINDSVEKLLQKTQKKLIKHVPGPGNEDEDANGDKETQRNEKSRKMQSNEASDDDAVSREPAGVGRKSRSEKTQRGRKTKSRAEPNKDDYSGDESAAMEKPSKGREGRSRKKTQSSDEESDLDYEEAEISKRPPSRRARISGKRTAYTEDDSESSVEVVPEPSTTPRRKARNGRSGSSEIGTQSSSRKSLSQSQLSFTSVKRNSRAPAGKRKRAIQVLDSDEDEDPDDRITSYEMDEDWGTAKTDTFET